MAAQSTRRLTSRIAHRKNAHGLSPALSAAICAVLRNLHAESGLSLSGVARVAGVGRSYVHYLLGSNPLPVNPTIGALHRVAGAYGTTCSSILHAAEVHAAKHPNPPPAKPKKKRKKGDHQ